MWILLLGLTFGGLVASSWANALQEVKVRGCSYRGVFHIQGNTRYSLDFEEAQKQCEALGTTLASFDQINHAYAVGLESCRYGWVSSGNITISRHVPNALCAANLTGVINLIPPESHYDAYCYDKTGNSNEEEQGIVCDLSDKNCTYEINDVGNDLENLGHTEGTESQALNKTKVDFSSTVDPEQHTNSSVTALTDLAHAIDQTNPIPTSSQGEPDVFGGVLDQSTQPPTTTTEETTEDYDLGTENPGHTEEPGRDTKKHTTIMPSLDSTGSGMGETTHITTSEADTGDSMDTSEEHVTDLKTSTVHPTATSTEDDPVSPDQSVHQRGRMGLDVALPPEENSSSGSTTDWLIILVVVVAIAAIILVGALVVTRNRWCGRSQSLMITSKSSSEGNGTAASATSPQAQEREQEMVTLMNKEKIQENGNTEEFTVITLEESPEKNQQA